MVITPSSIVVGEYFKDGNAHLSCLSNVCGPGPHRKLWSGFLQVKSKWRWLSLPGLPGIIIVVV